MSFIKVCSCICCTESKNNQEDLREQLTINEKVARETDQLKEAVERLKEMTKKEADRLTNLLFYNNNLLRYIIMQLEGDKI